MAENCSVLDPLASLSESAWISEASARENEALTRALQISLSDTASSSSGAASPSVATSSSSPFLLRHHQNHLALPASTSAAATPRPLGLTPTDRVSKRKSRASNRLPTTYINADPANFREMVQRVTGIQVDGRALNSGPVAKSETARLAAGDRATLKQVCLPTLDTSALLLDSVAVRPDHDRGPFGPPDQVPAFDFDALLPIFPTFESWDAI